MTKTKGNTLSVITGNVVINIEYNTVNEVDNTIDTLNAIRKNIENQPGPNQIAAEFPVATSEDAHNHEEEKE